MVDFYKEIQKQIIDIYRTALEKYADPINWDIETQDGHKNNVVFVPAWRCAENGWDMAQEVLEQVDNLKDKYDKEVRKGHIEWCQDRGQFP